MRMSSGFVMPRPPAQMPGTVGPSLMHPSSPAFTVSAPVDEVRSNTRIEPEVQAVAYALLPSGLTETSQAFSNCVSVVQPAMAVNDEHELTTGRHWAAAGAAGR